MCLSKLTKQQYRILCLALAEYRQDMEDGVRRCKYALDQTDRSSISRFEYRERIAEKLVVYEQRVKLVDEIMAEVASIYVE